MGEPVIKKLGPVQGQSRVAICRYKNQNYKISRLRRVLEDYPYDVLGLLVEQGFLDCACVKDAYEFICFTARAYIIEVPVGHILVFLFFWRYAIRIEPLIENRFMYGMVSQIPVENARFILLLTI